MNRTLHLIILYTALQAAIVPQPSRASVPMEDCLCPMVRIEAERLPDLNTPRGGHQTLVVGDELMVAGGHTLGFVPTPTAEFLRPGDKSWRQQATVYTHDFGTSAQLLSGEVLLMGGAAEPLGIGQTHSVERYDPRTRTFHGFGCLDTKRMYASAEQLTSGEVAISGNWYHDDAMELFDGEKRFTPAKDVVLPRACPYIFPTADGDALVIGAIDNRGHGETEYATVVERLRGEPFSVPLLSQWQPLRLLYPHPAQASCIGDTAQGDYTYLMVVADRNAEMRIAVVRTDAQHCPSDSAITLLPGLSPLPTTGPEGQPIGYISTVLVDRAARYAYVVGHDVLLNTPPDVPNNGRDSLARHYVFAFDYDGSQPATHNSQPSNPKPQTTTLRSQISTLYYTDPLPGIGTTTPVLTPDGDIVLAGGVSTDNFAPFGGAYRLPIGHPSAKAHAFGWLWWLSAAVLAVAAIAVARCFKARPTDNQPQPAAEATPETDLMARIQQLMEQEHLYLNSSLTVADVADRLGVHRNAVSQTINTQPGRTFAMVISGYRVAHAQQLMRQQPDKKLSAVAEESGFATESSFFRTFKTIVGMTPREWVAQGMKS